MMRRWIVDPWGANPWQVCPRCEGEVQEERCRRCGDTGVVFTKNIRFEDERPP